MPPRSPASRPADASAALAPRPLQKGRQTRVAILDAALHMAAQGGLEGLSIGALAELSGMSKSGVFAHFGSREGLQIAVIREYHARFEAEIFVPAMRAPRGLPRLRALIDLWLRRVSAEIESGCIYIGGAVEFDDRPGPVRDALATMVRTWRQALERALQGAIAEGHLRRDTDPQQVLFEIHGLALAAHHDARFLQNAGAADRARCAVGRLIAACSPEAPARPGAARARRSERRSASRSPRRRSTSPATTRSKPSTSSPL